MTTEREANFVERERSPGDHVYLLVDGLAACETDHPLSVPSLIRSFGSAAVTRVLRPDLAHSPEDCPALIQLAGPGELTPERYLIYSASYSIRDLHYNKRYICGWLLSPEPLDVIATQIAARCHTTAPVGEQASPWFEPLRLELLAIALGGRVGDLLGPIRVWLCPASWDGHTLVRGARYPVDEELLQTCRETQQLAPLISHFLSAWRHTLKQPFGFAPWRWKGSTVLPPKAACHGLNLVQDARRLGLRDSRTITSFCLHRVFLHPHLPKHPEIQGLIAQARAGSIDLKDHFASHYSENQWQRIVADLPHAKDYS